MEDNVNNSAPLDESNTGRMALTGTSYTGSHA